MQRCRIFHNQKTLITFRTNKSILNTNDAFLFFSPLSISKSDAVRIKTINYTILPEMSIVIAIFYEAKRDAIKSIQ